VRLYVIGRLWAAAWALLGETLLVLTCTVFLYLPSWLTGEVCILNFRQVSAGSLRLVLVLCRISEVAHVKVAAKFAGVMAL
jgi:hypothetical protein